MGDLIETSKRFCMQYNCCKDCPLHDTICIDYEGQLFISGDASVNDMVRFAHHIKAFSMLE